MFGGLFTVQTKWRSLCHGQAILVKPKYAMFHSNCSDCGDCFWKSEAMRLRKELKEEKEKNEEMHIKMELKEHKNTEFAENVKNDKSRVILAELCCRADDAIQAQFKKSCLPATKQQYIASMFRNASIESIGQLKTFVYDRKKSRNELVH